MEQKDRRCGPQGSCKRSDGLAGEHKAQTPATAPEGGQARGLTVLQLALVTFLHTCSPPWLHPESSGKLQEPLVLRTGPQRLPYHWSGRVSAGLERYQRILTGDRLRCTALTPCRVSHRIVTLHSHTTWAGSCYQAGLCAAELSRPDPRCRHEECVK